MRKSLLALSLVTLFSWSAQAKDWVETVCINSNSDWLYHEGHCEEVTTVINKKIQSAGAEVKSSSISTTVRTLSGGYSETVCCINVVLHKPDKTSCPKATEPMK